MIKVPDETKTTYETTFVKRKYYYAERRERLKIAHQIARIHQMDISEVTNEMIDSRIKEIEKKKDLHFHTSKTTYSEVKMLEDDDLPVAWTKEEMKDVRRMARIYQRSPSDISRFDLQVYRNVRRKSKKND